MTYKLKYREAHEMKDSGVEWLGNIPESWNVSKLKFVIKDFITGGTPSSSNQNYYTEFSQGIPWVSISDMSSNRVVSRTKSSLTQSGLRSKNLSVLNKGTLIYSIFATLGKVSELDIKATTNQAILGLINNQLLVSNKYLKYWLINLERNLKFYSSANTQENLNTEKVKNFKFLQPDTLKKQQNIANFLDIKTSEFNSIISKKEVLIEKLEEAKKSLISEVVTGKVKIVDGKLVGREAHEMKDSGIEWLGKIPFDWVPVKLKLTNEVKDGTHDTPQYIGEGGDTYPLITTKNLTNGKLNFSDVKHISRTDHFKIIARSNVAKGDIIMPMIGTIGNPVIVATSKEFSIKNVALFKKSKIIASTFLYYMLKSDIVDYQLKAYYRGGVQNFVSLDILRNLIILKTKESEQVLISKLLDLKIKNLDSIINKISKQIIELKEAKQSLISETITGKIDLRDWEIEEV